MRDSTIIYRSFYEAIKDLDVTVQGEVWKAVFEYSLNFKSVELTGIAKTVFTLIKPQLDANIKRYKNGKKPKQKQEGSKPEAKNKRTISKTEANKNENVNENNNGNQNEDENSHSVFSIRLLSKEFEFDKEQVEVSTKVSVTEDLLKQFNANLHNSNVRHHHFSEYKKHLVNWIPKKPKEESNKQTKVQNILSVNEQVKNSFTD
jgi:hypothetical protein